MRVYNTLSRKKEEFIPLEEGKVKMYACGPTVYDYIHVGNARPMVVFDTLRNFFEYKGYDVDYVVNFTDIDDKVIERANKEGLDYSVIAERYIKAFKEDTRALNIKDESIKHPRATEYIQPIIEFIQALIDIDAAYNVDGNVYFNIEKAENYGKLSRKNLEDLIAGARVDISDEKKSPADFALWKKAKDNEPYWESPWGKGRPGWHIECSVMAGNILGETIDIHAGGEDLQFPHHENEIAQSETLTGKTMARYWMHNGMLTIDNEKMSKSLGNFFTVKDIAKHFDLEVLRFFLLSTHYRMPINFSYEIMDQMKNSLERLYNGKRNLEYQLENAGDGPLNGEIKEVIDGFKGDFDKAMSDDLNTADGITSLFELVRYSNSNIDKNESKETINYALNSLLELANVLGLLSKEEEILEDDIMKLIEERSQARKEKNFSRADEIRDELLDKGIILEDTQEGVKWKRI